MFKPCPTRVLIADDDPPSLSLLRHQLSVLGYLVVAEAADGREAVSLARQLCPDVIVLKLEMPNMDGLQASKYIDQEGLCPVILLCDCNKSEWVQEACSLLAVQAYLVKPVSERNLEPAVELALARFKRFERPRAPLPGVA
jgi:two-component system, response regulator PdtaR